MVTCKVKDWQSKEMVKVRFCGGKKCPKLGVGRNRLYITPYFFSTFRYISPLIFPPTLFPLYPFQKYFLPPGVPLPG